MKRIGKCRQCGACCIVTKIDSGVDPSAFGGYGVPCKHLVIKDTKAFCKIYEERWPECRKHPEDPLVAVATCAFKFIVSPEEVACLFEKHRIALAAEDMIRVDKEKDRGYNDGKKNKVPRGVKGAAKRVDAKKTTVVLNKKPPL